MIFNPGRLNTIFFFDLTHSDSRNDGIKRYKGFQNERNSMDNKSEKDSLRDKFSGFSGKKKKNESLQR